MAAACVNSLCRTARSSAMQDLAYRRIEVDVIGDGLSWCTLKSGCPAPIAHALQRPCQCVDDVRALLIDMANLALLGLSDHLPKCSRAISHLAIQHPRYAHHDCSSQSHDKDEEWVVEAWPFLTLAVLCEDSPAQWCVAASDLAAADHAGVLPRQTWLLPIPLVCGADCWQACSVGAAPIRSVAKFELVSLAVLVWCDMGSCAG